MPVTAEAKARGDVAVMRGKDGAAAIDAVAASAPVGRRFLRAAWYAGWGDATLATAVARDRGGRPVAALPLVRVGPGMLRARTVPGCYWPFRGPALADGAGAETLCAMLRDPGTQMLAPSLLRVGPVYDDAALACLRAGALAAGWSILERQVGRSFLLDIGPGAPAPRGLARVAGYRRKLAGEGAVTLRTVSGAAWTDRVLEQLGGIEAASWIARRTDGSGAKFIDAGRRARWLRVLADPTLAAALHATILAVDGEPVAFSFDLVDGRMQYAIASSYAEKWAKWRVGRIVTAHQLDVARDLGVETVDLGAGDSGYKAEMGAVPGPAMLDCLLIRRRALATLLRRWWAGAGSSAGLAAIEGWVAQPYEPRRRPGPRPSSGWEQLLAAAALAAAAMVLAE